MVLRTKEIIGRGETLSAEQIRGEIAGIMCRCTGYQQIISAVERAQAQAAGDRRASVVPSGPSVADEEPTAQDMED